ncbi:hypothetical protein ACFL3T_03365 [Patescibacteria group bacterium]
MHSPDENRITNKTHLIPWQLGVMDLRPWVERSNNKNPKILWITNLISGNANECVEETTGNPCFIAKFILGNSELNEQEKKAAIESFQQLVDSIELTETDPYKAGLEIRKFLSENGWKYENKTFALDKMLQTKSGNCLGLTLLIGAILESKGIHPNYGILSNPVDVTHKRDIRILEALENEGFFTWDDPKLFSLREWDDKLANIERPQRFSLAEHPVIISGDKMLETTSLDVEEQTDWQPNEYDTIRELSFEQLASVLITESIIDNHYEIDPKNIYEKLISATNHWPGNYDAFFVVAGYEKNKFIKKWALNNFNQLAIENARYYYMRYLLTNDIEDIKKCYELCPTSADVYLKYSKRTCDSDRDRKFYLAVASYMVAFSSERTLDSFYEKEEEYIRALFGDDYYLDLMDGVI